MAIRIIEVGPGDAEQPEGELPEPVVHLVPMRRRHLRSVLRIEGQVYPRPWSLPLFMSELNMRNSRYYVVARFEGSVVGYCGMMFTGDDAHVTTIAVDPSYQRQKIGTRLLLQGTQESLARGCRHLTLEVRIGNVAAQTMYRQFGFKAAGVRKNYYAESNEDALVMWAEHIDTEEYAKRLDVIEAGVPGTTIVDAGQ